MLDEATHVLDRLYELTADKARSIAEHQQDRACRNPYKLPNGHFVRCGSRINEVCPSCARLAHGDWSAIMRSGIFDADTSQFTFVFLTCTAPSFGQVHRVPKTETPAWCVCGGFHTAADVGLAGTPVDYATYDFYSATRFNRDVGMLWSNTRRSLEYLLPGVEYVKVHEPQARLVTHLHAILRVPASTVVDLVAIEDVVRTVTATGKIDGMIQRWGVMTKALTVTAQTFATISADDVDARSTAARTVGYMSKMINYLGKSIGERASGAAQRHMQEMNRAAAAMVCSNCPPPNAFGWRPQCKSKLHREYGMRSVVVTTSRRGKAKIGWSFSGMTRRLKRQERRTWMEEVALDPERAAENGDRRMIQAHAAANYLSQERAREKHFNSSGPADAPHPVAVGHVT